MIKRLLSLLMATVILCLTSITVFAENDSISNQDIITISETQLISSVNDPEKLQEIIEKENLSVPEGYYLEKVETFVYSNDDFEFNPEPEPQAILYEIKNVRHSPNQFIYVNQYDSDWFYGPSTISITYSRTNKVEKDIGVSIGNGTVSAAVGYKVSVEYTNSKTFNSSVAAGKKLNVKVHTNYTSTQFDIYNKWTGNLVEKDAWTAKPIGLVFKQYTYNQ